MVSRTTQYRVHECSQCLGDTEYYCKSCLCELCLRCKENHAKDLNTIHHIVTLYNDNLNHTPTEEICLKHPFNLCKMYCEPCQVPVCDFCSEHKSHVLPFSISRFGNGHHKILNIQRAFRAKHKKHRGTIHTIKSDALFFRPDLLTRIKADVKACHTEFSLYPSMLKAKANKVNELLNHLRKAKFKHSCLKQKIKMNIHLASIQIYEQIYDQSAISPVQFLSTIKTVRLPYNQFIIHRKISITESINKKDVLKFLFEIQITKKGNRSLGIDCPLELMSAPEIHKSFTLTRVNGCGHISNVTLDQLWVNDRKNVILTNTAGAILYHFKNSCRELFTQGLFTINSEGDLFYIDDNYNIKKIAKDMKTTSIFLRRKNSTLKPQCVYWSPSEKDLLVGMIGKVTRYNQTGQLTQTIKHDNTGKKLYSKPNYITENNNGNVVVSDYYDSGVVVVTDREGRHRFTYTGHPSGSGLRPRGICTDALSHILLSDYRNHTVQMIDKDGQFLLHLLTKSHKIGKPWCLDYDINTHRLWVGSWFTNKVHVYRYINRQAFSKGKNPPHRPDVVVLPSSTSA